MLKNSVIELVDVEPVEYHNARKDFRENPVFNSHCRIHNARIIRYRNLSFSPNLTQKDIEFVIEHTRMKKRASVHNNPDRYLFYQYGDSKPLIILDMLERKICTTKGKLKEYGERICQQQASIVLRLLKKYKFANFKRVSVTANPWRIGRTKEDREITFKALNRLFGEK
jgi:hypothetical protein